MSMSIVLARMAGENVALPMDIVSSVIELESVSPVPGAPAHVAGLTALRSQVITVIDCCRALGLESAAGDSSDYSGALALIVNVDDFQYALIADHVDEAADIEDEAAALPTSLAAGWEAAASGMVETRLGPALLLDAKKLVSGYRPARAEAIA